MASLAQVYIIDVPYHADKPYTYYIPATVEESVVCGCVVEVPFGRGNRCVTGVVTEITAGEPDARTKPISSVVGDGALLDSELIGLCSFVKSHTLCTFGDALRAVVPSSAMAKIVTYYRVTAEDGEKPKKAESLNDRGLQVYAAAAAKKRFTKQALQTELDFDVTRTLGQLIEKGLIERCVEHKGSAKTKTVRVMSLSAEFRMKIDGDDSVFEAEVDSLKGENQKKLLRAVRENENCPDTALFEEIGLTTSGGRAAFAALEKKGLLSLEVREEFRNHFTTETLLRDNQGEEYVRPTLSDEQQRAADTIIGLCDGGKPAAALLHGVTGSGKTNVIMEAIDHTLECGRGVIMLVPEIALTPQTVGIFVRRYGDRIAVIHSSLSGGERYDAWRRIRDGIATVVVGTRSAVFAPMKNIGLIVIDEEQEYTYKSDTNPKYLAHDIARYRCKDHNAVMVLASATPSITSYYKAKQGSYTLIELKERYGGARLPEALIYDMRGEVTDGNTTPIGGLLAYRLTEDKAAGNQSILFLNRRGYNNYVACTSCGKSIKCPNCSVTLTYHSTKARAARKTDENFETARRENGYLVCHTCGFRTKVPDKCPECGKEHFMFMGCGTQKAEDDIVSALPGLRVLRMDYDTTQAKYSHEEILKKFRDGEADVLLGTQMVTKGHDFPRVATVGVLSADAAFTVEDYRANERTFAMLTQVIGRAGRADVKGCAVIQTYDPDNAVINMAAKQDYIRFYESEIKVRKAMCFPPFCDIAVITLSSADEGYLGLVTTRMYQQIVEHTKTEFTDVPIVLYGPFEAPIYKVQNMFRMRFVMKCRLVKRTRDFISELMTEFGKSQGESRITISVDLNPSTV